MPKKVMKMGKKEKEIKELRNVQDFTKRCLLSLEVNLSELKENVESIEVLIATLRRENGMDLPHSRMARMDSHAN